MQSFNNGKITINDKSVKINGLLGMSEVIQREDIESVQAIGNMFFAIINIVLIVGIYKGYKMISGNKLVTIKKYNGKEVSFWMSSNEVDDFKANL
jgi:hypothetical protein